jgi:hypothetical protein
MGGLDSGTCPRGCCNVDAAALARGSRTSPYGSSPTTLPLLLSCHLPGEHGRNHMGPSNESGIKSRLVEDEKSPCGALDAECDAEKRARSEVEESAASAKTAARKRRRKIALRKKKETDKDQEKLERKGRAAKRMRVSNPIQAPMPPPMEDQPPIIDNVHAITSKLSSTPFSVAVL